MHLYCKSYGTCGNATKQDKRVDIFEKYSYTKFNGNPSSWSRVLHADRGSDMMKLRVAFLTFCELAQKIDKNFVSLRLSVWKTGLSHCREFHEI